MKNIWAGRAIPILSMDDLMTGFRFAGLDWDADDIENCMVSMMDQKIVAGYVSHGTGVVLAKKDPFPHYSVRLDMQDL
jgi:hypothetical protein